MIRRNPAVPDNIFELRRHDRIGDYARAYGDEIARAYEDLNIIVVPHFPLSLDLEFLRGLQWPAFAKKAGTSAGIEKSVFARKGDQFGFDGNQVLYKIFKDVYVAGYLQNQILSVNSQVREALRVLFPRYYSLTEGNTTWRMTDTVDEGMHVDGFNGGRPTAPEKRGLSHRIKMFINIDSEPRKWWTSFRTPEILKRYRAQFPDAVADDIDMLTYRISGRDFTQTMPYHEIDIPPMGAVISEASCIAHAVRYGRRVIAAEFFCATSDMLDPAKSPQAQLSGWLKDAGIAIDPNPQPVEIAASTAEYEKNRAVVI